MLPFRAADENVKDVPVVTVPVFVTASVGLAVRQVSPHRMITQAPRHAPGMPRSQPEMKGLATARTSEGVNGMSNAWGIALPPLRMLSTVW